MIEEKKIVTREVITYISEDGKRFSYAGQCINYENDLKREKILDGVLKNQIGSGAYSYTWYLCKTNEELKAFDGEIEPYYLDEVLNPDEWFCNFDFGYGISGCISEKLLKEILNNKEGIK